MSVWSGLKNIIDTMNRGAHQEDWNKIAAQEEAIKSEQQRRLLAQNADARAEAGAGREAEGYEYGKSRRGTQEQADALRLRGAELGNQAAEFGVTNQAADRQRKIDNEDAANKRADLGLKLEAGRLSLASKEAFRLKGATDAQIKQIEANMREQQATSKGRIENTNFQNSPSGRKDVEMQSWVQILKELDPGSEEYDTITKWLMEKSGIAPQQKPGMLERFFGKPQPTPGPTPWGDNYVGRIR